jgi:hypothetical protein
MHASIIPVQASDPLRADKPPRAEPATPRTLCLFELISTALASGQDSFTLTIHMETAAATLSNADSCFHDGMTAAQFCKGLNGVNVMQLGHFLKGRRWLYNQSTSGTRWRVASYARSRYMVEQHTPVAPPGKDPFIAHTPVLLPKGAVRLYELYQAGRLPMKKNWDGRYTVVDVELLRSFGRDN